MRLDRKQRQVEMLERSRVDRKEASYVLGLLLAFRRSLKFFTRMSDTELSVMYISTYKF